MRRTLVVGVCGGLMLLAEFGCSGGGDTNAQTSVSVSSGTGGDGAVSSASSGGQGGSTSASSGSGGAGGNPECVVAADCDDSIGCTIDSCVDGSCEHTSDSGVCDNGAFCDGSEICDPANGDAVSGCSAAALDPCDDGVTCTADSCDEATDSCANTPGDAACDNGDFCDGVELCDPTNGDPLSGCIAAADDPCDDSASCTADSCDEATDACSHTPNDGSCDNGAFCDGAEVCDPATGEPLTGCAAAAAPPCSDSIGCTVDGCDEAIDSCTVTPNHAACDNAVFCDGVELCDPANGDPNTGCASSSGDPCLDQAPCTVDSCDEVADSCSNVPNDGFCDDSTFCNGAEFCNLMTGTCDMGTPPSCADAFSCTSDFCDANTDACSSVAVDTNCSNSTFCDGVETCDPINPAAAAGTGCMPGAAVVCDDNIPCTADSCDEQAQGCSFAPDDVSCADTSFCNGAEVCVQGVGCQPGNAVLCDDGLSCTANSCDDVQAQCVFTPNDQACSDGQFCSGTETCNPAAAAPGSGCDPGSTVSCNDDGIACTVESCDEQTMGCVSTPDNSLCPMGEFCVPSLNGCVPSPPCNNNAECDDMDACNGVESCNVVCQPGTPVSCDDGITCTDDSCNPADGTCGNVVDSSKCDDGFVCNGSETCDAVAGCLAGASVNCDDGVGCTVDVCNEPNGTCSNQPQNSLCDDSMFCTGVEVCDPLLDCVGGAPPTCDDGVACTADTCDAVLDQCVAQPDSSSCPCGQTCDAQTGCGNYCQIAECSGKVYECGDCVDNDNDCGVDTGGDSMCLGPCDNNEQGYAGEIPGQNSAPCKQDCYFDGDTGAGNDDCYWSHTCDPLEVAPNYYPEGPQCSYDPNANVPGSSQSCSQLQQAQSQTCGNVCAPLTPNGCDCFGCCEIPGAPTPVWLGSESGGSASCTEANLADPSLCQPCTIVQSCFNTCDNCEICLGKPLLPPECLCQECQSGQQLCGEPCGTPCPFGQFCNSGCCVAAP